MIDVDPVAAVRLLIADVSTDETKRLLTDGQVQTFLAINDGRVRRAAADALDAIATSEVLVSKKIRTQDLATDGPAVAAELRARARQLRDQDDEDDAREWGGFDLVNTLPPTCRPELTEHEVWGL